MKKLPYKLYYDVTPDLLEYLKTEFDQEYENERITINIFHHDEEDHDGKYVYGIEFEETGEYNTFSVARVFMDVCYELYSEEPGKVETVIYKLFNKLLDEEEEKDEVINLLEEISD